MQISGNAFYSGVSTLQSGQRRVEQAGSDIAGSSLTRSQDTDGFSSASAVSGSEITDSLVNLSVGESEAQAGARLVATADEVLGTLIDIRA